MSKLKVEFDETEELLCELKSNLEDLEEVNNILEKCIESLNEQKSPKKVAKLYDEIKDLKKAMKSFSQEKLEQTIKSIEEGCANFKEEDNDTASKLGE